MAEPVLYLFRPERDAVRNLTRREIFWLVKDRLVETEQIGWSFAHGQVEPYPPSVDEGVLGQLAVETTPLKKAVEAFFEGQRGFIVPLEERIDVASIVDRLATVEQVGVIQDVQAPQVEPITGNGNFWETYQLKTELTTGSPGRRAAFNIVHPYQEGPLFDANTGREFRLTPTGIEPANVSDGPLYSVFFATELSKIEGLVGDIQELVSRVPTGTYLATSNHCEAESRFAMDEQDIKTDALSAGSVLVELSGNLTRDSAAIDSFVEKLDRYGLSLSGEFAASEATYFVFKFHPRHGDVETAGPPFSGNRERRKLSHTEWARDHLPGYKRLSSGVREVTVASFDEWDISVQRPGRKDADDFTYHINGPGVSGVKETKPHLHRIFNDVARHLYCPDSGTAFLDALYRIWDAEIPMDDCVQFVEEVDKMIPACSDDENLWYDRQVLLYSLALQFVVEDLNYRFNFHPTYGGPSYRKQGRDQPMNGLLQVGADQLSEDEIEEVAESTKSGGLLERPQTFSGPAHLRDWYQDHVLAVNKSNSSLSNWE
ncbi:hypothetical protein [Salinigranum halophilum]|uniref:hypothetical protein n=1 Tax=Salinigranum halophilum TaxID=2565931 RepID=UPI0010A87747|nr:hypothetical protein [Salinigranum halophilum]